ncbi:MAG: electron transfer flavoprotein subunit alpha/FixB family protein [Ignavibacteria bacterium]|nr:electron transfer flavoprotein subunit alpha/FixB family protein [Ignavibacteria bacterium]
MNRLFNIKNQPSNPEVQIYPLADFKNLIDRYDPDLILSGDTYMAKDILPRAAISRQYSMLSDCYEVNIENNQYHVKRNCYGGKVSAIFHLPLNRKYCFTIKPNSILLKTIENSDFEVIETLPSKQCNSPRLIEIKAPESSMPELTEAEIIVSGGMGMKTKENFAKLYELAQLLNGSIGASRPVVDSKFIGQEMQVGQTGKTVSPKLYFSFGISGAIQHIAGIRSSKYIVAVNEDAEAPMFEYCDYGIVEDAIVFLY